MRAPSWTSSSSSRARCRLFRRDQPRRCSGSDTFSSADSVGSRLKNWKMKPILSRRTRVSSSSDEAAEALAVDVDLARGRPVEAADQVEQRRLAGAGRPDDRHHLAAIDAEGDVVERRDLLLPSKCLETPESSIIKEDSVLGSRFSGSHAQSTEN